MAGKIGSNVGEADRCHRWCSQWRRNAGAGQALKIYRGRKIKLLFAAMSDKDWRLMLTRFTGVVSEATFTKVAMERSADPAELATDFAGRIASRSHPDRERRYDY